MYQTVFEKGIEKGRREERMELVISLLEERFGPPSEVILAQLQLLPMDDLRRPALKIATATSMTELDLPL